MKAKKLSVVVWHAKRGKPIADARTWRPFPRIDNHEAFLPPAKACDHDLSVWAAHSGYILAECVNRNIWPSFLDPGFCHGDRKEKPGTRALQPRPAPPRVQCGQVSARPSRDDYH